MSNDYEGDQGYPGEYQHQEYDEEDENEGDDGNDGNDGNIGETKKRKRRGGKRAKKDPRAPKRSKSAYIFFAMHKRDEVKANLPPKAKVGEIAKVTSAMFRALPPEERETWENYAKADRERYQEEKANYTGPLLIHQKKELPKEGPGSRGGGPKPGMKDPRAPKRSKSAYIFFSIAKRDEVKSHLPPKAKVSEVAKGTSALWKALSDDERQIWVDLALKDRERYQEEKSNYTGPLLIQPDSDTENAVSGGPKRAKDPNKPKRPLTAFLYYCKDYRPALKEQNPSWGLAELSKQLGVQWRALSEEGKRPYLDREEEERKEWIVINAEYKKNKKVEEARRLEEQSATPAIQMKKGKPKKAQMPYAHPVHVAASTNRKDTKPKLPSVAEVSMAKAKKSKVKSSTVVHPPPQLSAQFQPSAEIKSSKQNKGKSKGKKDKVSRPASSAAPSSPIKGPGQSTEQDRMMNQQHMGYPMDQGYGMGGMPGANMGARGMMMGMGAGPGGLGRDRGGGGGGMPPGYGDRNQKMRMAMQAGQGRGGMPGAYGGYGGPGGMAGMNDYYAAQASQGRGGHEGMGGASAGGRGGSASRASGGGAGMQNEEDGGYGMGAYGMGAGGYGGPGMDGGMGAYGAGAAGMMGGPGGYDFGGPHSGGGQDPYGYGGGYGAPHMGGGGYGDPSMMGVGPEGYGSAGMGGAGGYGGYGGMGGYQG